MTPKKTFLTLLSVGLLALICVSLFVRNKQAQAVGLPLPSLNYNTSSDAATLYAQLSILDARQRKEFYGQLDGLDKAKVWGIHFTAYALDHKLTPVQAALVQQLCDAVRGADLNKDGRSIAEKFIPRQQEFLDAFGKQAAWELVQNLGGHSPFSGSQVRIFKTGFRFEGGSCGCSRTDNWCGEANGLPIPCGCPQSCVSSNWGCGWFWDYACDGLCVTGPCPPPIH